MVSGMRANLTLRVSAALFSGALLLVGCPSRFDPRAQPTVTARAAA